MEVQTGECSSETSLTISFSHSSVMQADALSSMAVGSKCEVSFLMIGRSIVEFDCATTSGSFGPVAFGSYAFSSNPGAIDLKYSYQKAIKQMELSPLVLI